MTKSEAFVDVMFHSADQTHLWHLQTKSYAMHMALGGYYDAIRAGADDIAEKLMGFNGKRVNASGKTALVPFKDTAQVVSHLNSIGVYLKGLNNEILAADKSATHITNAIDTVRETVEKTKYLLTLS